MSLQQFICWVAQPNWACLYSIHVIDYKSLYVVNMCVHLYKHVLAAQLNVSYVKCEISRY